MQNYKNLKINNFKVLHNSDFQNPSKLVILPNVYPQNCGNVDNLSKICPFYPKFECLNIHKWLCIIINLWISGNLSVHNLSHISFDK